MTGHRGQPLRSNDAQPALPLKHALDRCERAEAGTNVTVGASVGSAIYPEDAKTCAGLLKIADAAMHAAKRRDVCIPRETGQAAI